ncbi:uncharacterized protein LOC110036821 [Phalaenopsis equestris]|uniref:uncharacterized protein LOC110036821 n=1 Tax=Phalaenopsis equestris TaxID=78828 RepID=UPI0009E454E7|nr:uncharacterized protein LOC110036821 [Phalaenopsis equestris]
MEIMKARGFTKDSSNIIQRWLEGNANTVLINGKTHGFFKANRGLRQGDLSSPTIFILALDYLSKIIDKPGNRKDYNIYLNRSEQDISHLIYADDILIFSRTNKNAIKNQYADMQKFQQASGLEVNKEKNHILFNKKYSTTCKQWTLELTGFKAMDTPFKYLGVYLTKGRNTKGRNKQIVDKTIATLQGWTNSFLSNGGTNSFIPSCLMEAE